MLETIIREVSKDQYYILLKYEGKEYNMNLEKSQVRHLIQTLDNGI